MTCHFDIPMLNNVLYSIGLDLFSPAGCLQEVSEELLVAREGWGRTGTHNSMRLNETLFKTLQTPQAVSSQHA